MLVPAARIVERRSSPEILFDLTCPFDTVIGKTIGLVKRQKTQISQPWLEIIGWDLPRCSNIDWSQLHSGRTKLIPKMLRFWQAGHSHPTRLLRINRALSSGIPLVVKGEASIYGPNLVAWPVGSEWRNRHLQRAVIQSNAVPN